MNEFENGEKYINEDEENLGVRYYPVTINDEIIGYLYATEDDEWASFMRRMESPHDTFRAAVEWSNRLGQAGNYGFSPLQAVRHWVGKPAHPTAGGIPADSQEQRAPNRAALERLANPMREGNDLTTSEFNDLTESEFSEGLGYSGAGWHPHQGGYDFLTAGPVHYMPVARQGEVLGYIWASETGDAADFVHRTGAGPAGIAAGEVWMSRLDRAAAEGLEPLHALRRWVGEPEDSVAGGIAADAPEMTAPSAAFVQQLAREEP
jgi:hypothetical protein